MVFAETEEREEVMVEKKKQFDSQESAARQCVREGAKATKGKKQIIRLALSKGGKQTVSATVFGYLAFHKSIDLEGKAIGPSWVVTHVLSGLGFGMYFTTMRKAKELVWLLNQELDWSNDTEIDKAEAKKRVAWYRGNRTDVVIPKFLLLKKVEARTSFNLKD